MTLNARLRRLIARWRCHVNPLLCCQYTDTAQCNSPQDPHRYGRWRFGREKARL